MVLWWGRRNRYYVEKKVGEGIMKWKGKERKDQRNWGEKGKRGFNKKEMMMMMI